MSQKPFFLVYLFYRFNLCGEKMKKYFFEMFANVL